MKIARTKTFGFEAAHFLPCFPEGHKCRRMHGHSFKIDVVVEGEVDERKGYLIDFADVEKATKPLEDALDHRVLNEIEGLENPTAENLAAWIWRRLAATLPLLRQITVHETCTSQCIYRGG